MYGKRDDDPNPTIHFRADRIALINGEYYFATREGTMEGPYRTREEARTAINNYILRMNAPKAPQPGSPSFTLSLCDLH